MFKRLIAINFRKPSGLFGRYIIKFLKKNQIEYDEMDSLLKLNKDDIVLEIGFGLGKGIYDYSKKVENDTFHCIYFLNVIYFWDEIHSRLKKIFSILKQNGKVIIFMADAECFKDIKQPAGETIFYRHNIDDVVKEMAKIGFKPIETIEHTKEHPVPQLEYIPLGSLQIQTFCHIGGITNSLIRFNVFLSLTSFQFSSESTNASPFVSR